MKVRPSTPQGLRILARALVPEIKTSVAMPSSPMSTIDFGAGFYAESSRHIEQSADTTTRACRIALVGTRKPLLVAVGDSSAIQVVRRELDLHAVTGQDADVVAAHLAGDVTEDHVVVVELDAEHRVREGLHDL